MKLSDAAVLGAARWERVCYPATDRIEGEKKGCFLQLALRAVGFGAEEVTGTQWAKLTKRTWPWTEGDDERYLSEIWQMNDMGAPFEEILAYVRRYEPPELDAQAEIQMPSGFAAQPDSIVGSVALPLK